MLATAGSATSFGHGAQIHDEEISESLAETGRNLNAELTVN